MKHKMSRLLSLLLSVSMATSMMITPGFATEKKAADSASVTVDVADSGTSEKQITASDSQKSSTVDASSGISMDDISIDAAQAVSAVAITDDSSADEPDMSDPVMAVAEQELEDMTVQDEEGNSVALTDEQIQTVLYLYNQYQTQWTENADVLGVQMPFYLQYNDSEEDGLGVLGEMLVLAGYTVDDVRNGNYSYDDLTGMIQNFYYGDQLGIKYYGDKIKSLRDEALQAVEDSGATTDYQKLLVLNDWLATVDSFDMSYIMNSGKTGDAAPMKAQTETKHEHYDDVYDVLYEAYKPQIENSFRSQIKEQVTTQFHDQIFAGIETSLRQQYYESAIKNIVYQQALASAADPENPTDEEKAAAEETATNYMTENADAITEDAAGFVETHFGSDVATQLSTGADEFIASAETDGVEVSEGVTMTVEELTQQQLADDETLNVDMDGDGTNDTTFPDAIDAYTEAAMTSTDPALDLDEDGTNETSVPDAVELYTQQAASGLTTGVLNYWEGSHIGALGEGKSVCLGYAKAYSYLIQCMYPEYYGVDGASTDMTVASNWKTAQDLYYTDGALDITKDYNVDLVRISFDADVTMYGETQENFNSDHFWNAVKVNGTWYYVDPCYNDVYSEVMIRDRVETSGYINHMYFMFSHTTTTSLYDGYYSELKTLYADAATDKTYEDAWFSRAKSNVYSDGSNYYYVYDSTDTISMMDEYNNNSTSSDISELMSEEPEYKLVKHAISDTDNANGDEDYTALIEFNYDSDPDDDDDTTAARVYNPGSGEMEESELLTELYAQHDEQADIYPSIFITTALENGKLYFNLSNTILSYDLDSGEVQVVKQYKTVYGTRDKTNAFAGMAFSLSESSGDMTFKNHPIAGILGNGDGTLTVSVATNLAYISGKDEVTNRSSETDYTMDSADNGYGYEYEETNYNPDYNSYSSSDDTYGSMMEQFGYTEEINDNDEFMWVANLVGSVSVSDLSEVTYDEVSDLLINCEHHYIHFAETYFTKDDDSGEWNTGESYVCVKCGRAVEEPTEPKESSSWSSTGTTYEEQKAQYDIEKAEYDEIVASAGHTYEPTDAEWSTDEDGNETVTFSKLTIGCDCPDIKGTLDCLVNDDTMYDSVECESVTATAESSKSGTCDEGITTTYTATGTTEQGYKYKAVKKDTAEASEHDYQSEFEWTAVEDAADGEVPYTAKATVTCANCDFKETVDAVVESSTDDDGNTIYTATATLSNGDTVKEEKTAAKYELGDINGDESINMSDVTSLQQYATDLDTLTEDELARADLNSDGEVNMTDVTILQQYVSDIITELPVAS